MRAELVATSIHESLDSALDREREFGAAFNLAPVFLAMGIGAYFMLPREPLALIPAASTLIIAVLCWQMKGRGAAWMLCAALGLFAAGMAAAQFRVATLDAPVIAQLQTTRFVGTVLWTDRTASGGPRYLMRPSSIEGVAQDQLPARIRISTASRKYTVFQPGDAIAGRARLGPFPGPAYPGGYDFRFNAWFDRVGASGYLLGSPVAETASEPLGMVDRVQVAFAKLRRAIVARVVTDEGGDAAAVAAALITGDRSAISSEVQDSLRLSGLAHILAISGLHMALVTLTVVLAIRFAGALSQGLAMRHDIRKWAACVGIVAATAYLAISGGSIATQRSWLMIVIMLSAMLLDRRAVTLRNVALAAILILIMQPESLLDPGAQMSFAATAALVAGYEAWSKRKSERAREKPAGLPAFRLVAAVWRYISGIALTSLIAGTATAFFAAWHFQRVATLGLVANLLAMPVVSLLVMPLALLSALAMPYGAEGLFLPALEWSISLVIAISDWTNSFGLHGETGKLPAIALPLGGLALALLTGMRSRLRLLAGVFGAASLVVAFLLTPRTPPHLLISGDGETIAFHGEGGGADYSGTRRNTFTAELWQRAYWPGGEIAWRKEKCGKEYCLLEAGPHSDLNGLRVVIVKDPVKIAEACLQADIALAPRLYWFRCKGRSPSLILTRLDFENRGSVAIRKSQRKTDPGTGATETSNTVWAAADFEIEFAYPTDPKRPWQTAFTTVEPPDKRFSSRNAASAASQTSPETEPDEKTQPDDLNEF